MIRAVIFDFNGVIVDDEAIHYELLRRVLADSGVTITETEYAEEYLGYDDRGCLEVALGRAGQTFDRDRIDQLIARKAGLYEEWAERELRVFPGAAEVIRGLSVRWPLAVCSGALEQEIAFALEALGVSGEFEAIVAAEDTEACKPDPEGYLLALDALRASGHEDLEAGHCLVIEDSLAGIRAGKHAGMWVVAVAHTYTEPELRSAGADAVAVSLAEITPEWIEGLFRPEVSP
jgi:HAD superfamily hydrolase (TIGR01509 family)